MLVRRIVGVVLCVISLIFIFIAFEISSSFVGSIWWNACHEDITEEYNRYLEVKDITDINKLYEYLEKNKIDYKISDRILSFDGYLSNYEVTSTDNSQVKVTNELYGKIEQRLKTNNENDYSVSYKKGKKIITYEKTEDIDQLIKIDNKYYYGDTVEKVNNIIFLCFLIFFIMGIMLIGA